METGLIEEWLVPPGTPVKPGDLLLRLATDKVDVEVEAEGVGLFHPAVDSGVELPPGALIGWLLEAGEEVPSGAAALEAPPPVPAETRPTVVGEPGALTPTGRLFASPNARRVARERGVDVTQLNGTGPGGLYIITADVLETAAAPGVLGPAPKVVSPLVRRGRLPRRRGSRYRGGDRPGRQGAPLRRPYRSGQLRVVPGDAARARGGGRRGHPADRRSRGVIASRMHASLREMATAHPGHRGRDGRRGSASRAQLKEQWSQAGIPVPTITDLVIRAAAWPCVSTRASTPPCTTTRSTSSRRSTSAASRSRFEEGLRVPVVKRAGPGCRFPRSPLRAAGSRAGRPVEVLGLRACRTWKAAPSR